jgi:spore maturation protein CgeB
VVRDIYLARGWARRAFTWHEAADVRRFRPVAAEPAGDVVFVGNWGDAERTEELRTFLLAPVRELGLTARLHGVRYPPHARAELAASGVSYGGWLPNHRAPRTLAAHRVTVHVPRRPYAAALPGIPTIRPFEALACGVPLVCAPWDDAEKLFRPGKDYLVARDGAEMRRHLRAILGEPELARSLAETGLETVRRRHTCAHRVDELLDVLRAVA